VGHAVTAADPSPLVLAVVCLGYVLVAVAVMWGRHRHRPPPPADAEAHARFERQLQALRDRKR
jgi:hypothetical protein